MRTLVLWDIDHTLLSIDGLTAEVYATAHRRVTGQNLRALPDMPGKTERAIITETLHLNQITPTEELVDAFADIVAEQYAARIQEIRTRGRTLPGAHAAMQALAAEPQVIQSALTGNMRPIAEMKLAAFGLDEHLDLRVGAYGMDGITRPPLVDLARQRTAAVYGEIVDADHTVLIGDTPLDVKAGHLGGARVVAVATGVSDETALRAAGAELVLADLTDTTAVVEAVLAVSAA
ncbi:HAD family hydrolase [Thermomonospora cellulosilytica]|uniref:Phosphoglycolate phosphatase-like HAD superfamily hydrolase n=1 Tax=Thermomonospora cellulosilytica TaxID=1411118 RepID=A0A7W3R7Y7_9ACTN|nr:haloacid dehalogenase-like hydrolase [Thermomonospora cellulosilytica]MBA9002820.1 phosphoglycolate phosphatase-like HAD superfamily hydrolase [Thermomonospora cellulosilytica]